MQASYGISERRDCNVFPASEAIIRYKSRRPCQARLQMPIKESAATRMRYGYRRIHVLLQREAWRVRHKRVRRIYREFKLQLRTKTPKRIAKANLREGRVLATAADAMDFLLDQLFDERKVRIMSISLLTSSGQREH